MEQSDSTAICVAGALIRDGRVLLVRRSLSARHYPDVWDLFGGHVNRGESLEETLRREAREELGIDVLTLKWMDRIYDRVETAIVYLFTVSSWEGEPANAAPGEHSEVRWFGADELPESEAMDAYRRQVVWALGERHIGGA